MKLFVCEGGTRHIAMFGSGLIGSAIYDAVRAQGVWRSRQIPYDWEDSAQRQAALTIIDHDVKAAGIRKRQSCDIVWAAGISGFGATPSHMEREFHLVAELSRAAVELARQNPMCAVNFHLVSSAGGLFEGKTNVRCDAEPMPLRPYGIGKLDQEKLVLSLKPSVVTHIYRPASVYGYTLGGRQGLLATLIVNVLSNRSTLISGSERTLRDYVFSRDIGKYISRKILLSERKSTICLLASGKPTSMFEAISLIERLIGRPIYRRFESRASNALDLSFTKSDLPADFFTTPLEVGLSELRKKIQNSLICALSSRL